MIERSAYRFRIYPTTEQQRQLLQTFGCVRAVYNACLDQRRLEWHRSKPRRLSFEAQCAELASLKAAFPWLKAAPHHCLVQALRDLRHAFKRFFAGESGYPKPRRRDVDLACRFPDPLQFRIEDDAIVLPKIGRVAWVKHRKIIGKPKTVTVSLDGTFWHASVQVEREVEAPARSNLPSIGIDLGVVQPIVLSSGEVFALPRMSEAERRRLGALQQTLARRKKGSKNRAKAKRRIARFQARQRRRRLDAAHKASRKVVASYGMVVVEDLRLKNMTASAAGTVEAPGTNVRAKAGLNRSMLDVAPGQFRRLLDYKLKRAGGEMILVAPHFTSQTCSACGSVDAASRSGRRYACTNCGLAADSDVNAALNILRKGLPSLAGPTGGLPGMACGSSRSSGRKQERPGESP